MRKINVAALITLFILIPMGAQIVSTCFEDTFEFIIDGREETFDNSQRRCANQEATLASIPNEQTQSFVTTFIDELNIDPVDIWIGLRRLPDDELPDEDTTRPELFSFVDGTDFRNNFASINGDPPWLTNRPNNVRGLNQACVA